MSGEQPEMSDELKDLHVSPSAIKKITSGINGAIDELQAIGQAGAAEVGRGFSELALTGMETGYADLTAKFETFCERWEWGVRSLVKEALDLAEGAGLSAGLMHEADGYVQGTMKVGWTAAMGNPHLSEEDAEKRGWGQTLEDNPIHNLANPDYSAESMLQAGQDAEDTWKATAHDLTTDGMIGGQHSAFAQLAGYGDEYQAAADDAFGPDQKADDGSAHGESGERGEGRTEHGGSNS
ncbi:hypothetical protein [Streptomyces purpurogeneiscleroticus]|uniref:hypothetical protein n=1 Tax=Streptomyces purpurogeneiscleroticus TaxID=68259 RepID=UPI001CBAC053|nr:hypothetical protein [Streptomyces purpurogeneiscleroticus]MBZ4014293.1 hypothetical protein [Streptomyces purpurogeneiscleroticus]